MTLYEGLVSAALVGAAILIVRWHIRLIERGQGKPIFRSQRRAMELSRLSREGYELTDDGIVACKTCGENWCGQCGDSRIGFTFTEYKERYWE